MQQQTGYTIGYSATRTNLNENETFSIHVFNRPLEEVLNQILNGRGLDFGLVGEKGIVVIPAVVIKPATTTPELPQVKAIVVQTATGKVMDSLNEGLIGTSVSIKGTTRALATDENGHFSFPGIPVPSTLVFNRIGYESKELEWKGQANLQVILTEMVKLIEDVSVASTGYQQLKRSKTTGSYTVISNSLLNRSISDNILERIKGVASGVLFDESTGNSAGISIRGRSTIFGNSTPLIVLDNYPYEGGLDDINPNDIESITVLKDAVAASIWGTRAGNGVIVIQSKKGMLGAKPTVSFSSNFILRDKPDVYYRPQLSSAEYIDVQQFLFSKGIYNLNMAYPAVYPAVQIMFNRKNGLISEQDSIQQINALKQNDVRDDLDKYYYRKTFNQQYQVNVKGGTGKQTYYVSAGYDHDRLSNVGSSYKRLTLKGNHALYLLNRKLQINTDLFYTNTNSQSQLNPYTLAYPYARLSNQNGSAAEVIIPAGAGGLNNLYTDTAGGGRLLDWKYRPLDELNNQYSKSTTKVNDYRINLTAAYTIYKSLTLSANYQYNKYAEGVDQLTNANSFFVRNQVNTYTQVDPAGGLSFPYPKGDVLTKNNTDLHAHFGRFQANYEKDLKGKHYINAIAGYEIRMQDKDFNAYTLYGYNAAEGTSIPVNHTTSYPFYYFPTFLSGKIISGDNTSWIKDRNRSVYGNFSYVYNKRYIFTGSIRKDESNLFGVNANQKGVPLWSGGAGWIISKEQFYKLVWLPYLKFGASYGYNGNVDNSLTAYLTVGQAQNALGVLANAYGNSFYNIVTPPNPSLIWEKVRNINLMVEFGTANERILGTIEYYSKNGLDLIGNMPVAQQNGLTVFRGNSANIVGDGIDLQLTTVNIQGKIKWETILMFNYNREKVKDYKAKVGGNVNVVESKFTSDPLVDYPVRSVFAYRFAGLDTAGAPVGYIDGKTSMEYTTIQSSTNRNDLHFYGSMVPRFFGSLRNSFSYKNLSFSFNVIYKFNYFFRRPALDYSNLFAGGYQMPDFSSRWQQKGDELTTTVPAMVYPVIPFKDAFYAYSEALVEKGDHIRLQDLQLSVVIARKKYPKLPFKNLTINMYASNLGILWRANKKGLDPEALTVPLQKNYAIGLRADF